MVKRTTFRTGIVTSLVLLSLGLTACDSNDDDDDSSATADSTVDDGTDTGTVTGGTAGDDTDGAGDATVDDPTTTVGDGDDGAGATGDDDTTVGDDDDDAGATGDDDTTVDSGTDDGDGGEMAGGDGTDLPVDGDANNPDDTSQLVEGVETVSVSLDSSSTVPPATGAENASGTGDITVDTETGAILGSVTVSGTTGVPTMAHIHQGAPGEAGPVLVALEPNEDGTVWSLPEGAALDAAGIEAFQTGNLYVNVHTDANPDGELRAQLVDNTEEEVASGSVTVSFTNLSATQPMTPPVVILHNAPDSENGIRYFEVGASVGNEVRQIAEDGNITPLIEAAQGQIESGRVSAAEAAVPEAGGALLPGSTSSVTLSQEVPDQVMSIVVMVVCTNDGFTGVDSMEITEGTFTTPVYDAGSETNVEVLDWWVPPCGSETNETDQENGVIALHPGQADAQPADFNFEAGSELLEVTISVAE